MRRRHPARTCVLALVLVSGCWSWQTLNGGVTPERRYTVRAHLKSGVTAQLADATIREDSVVGRPWRGQSDERTAIARADIERLEVGTVRARTNLVIITGVLAVVLYALIEAVRHAYHT